MSILIVQTPAFNPNDGGVQRITFNLGRYFTKIGYNVAYFSFQKDNHTESRYGKLYHAKVSGLDDNSSNIDYLKEVVRSFKPNFVVNQMPYQPRLRHAMAEINDYDNIKVIACIHNSLFSFKSNVKDIMKRELPQPFDILMSTEPLCKIPLLYHKIKHRHDLKAILKAHHTTLLYTPPNYDELTYFLKPTDLKDSNVDFMPNPVADVLEHVPEKEKIILHVGRINIPQKRSDLLLDFWEQTYKQLPEWRFQILGHGPYSDTLAEDLKERGLPRVELLGYQKPEIFYEKAAIFMMPSAYEGFPNTVIEAQSFGCPVVAFNSYAALEWIVGEDNSHLLATPFDTSELAKLCVDLAKNKAQLETLQNVALKNAEQFTIEKVGKQWQELFEELAR